MKIGVITMLEVLLQVNISKHFHNFEEKKLISLHTYHQASQRGWHRKAWLEKRSRTETWGYNLLYSKTNPSPAASTHNTAALPQNLTNEKHLAKKPRKVLNVNKSIQVCSLKHKNSAEILWEMFLSCGFSKGIVITVWSRETNSFNMHLASSCLIQTFLYDHLSSQMTCRMFWLEVAPLVFHMWILLQNSGATLEKKLIQRIRTMS